MRTPFRSTGLAAATALALALGACTSEHDPAEETTPAATEEAAATGGPASGGWLCSYLGPSTLRAVAGQESQESQEFQEVTVQDDRQGWACEVRDGEQPLVGISIQRGEAARVAAQERAEQAEDVRQGPEYLGVSYLSPRLVTGLTLCRDVGSPGSEEYEPYTMVAEALTDSDDDVSDELRSALTQLAATLDQTVGCSPRMANQAAAATTP